MYKNHPVNLARHELTYLYKMTLYPINNMILVLYTKAELSFTPLGKPASRPGPGASPPIAHLGSHSREQAPKNTTKWPFKWCLKPPRCCLMLQIFRGLMPKEKGIQTFKFSSLVSSRTSILCNFVPWSFY